MTTKSDGKGGQDGGETSHAVGFRDSGTEERTGGRDGDAEVLSGGDAD